MPRSIALANVKRYVLGGFDCFGFGKSKGNAHGSFHRNSSPRHDSAKLHRRGNPRFRLVTRPDFSLCPLWLSLPRGFPGPLAAIRFSVPLDRLQPPSCLAAKRTDSMAGQGDLLLVPLPVSVGSSMGASSTSRAISWPSRMTFSG